MATARPRIFRIVCTTAYVYLGNYSEAIRCANDAAADKNHKYALTALCHRAYAEFLLGDHEALKNTAAEFSDRLSKASSEKLTANFSGVIILLDVLVAITENDVEKINELRSKLNPNEASKASIVSTRYFNGLAALTVGDVENAKIEFEWVKENGDKTVFSSLSDEKLGSLES